MSENRVIDDLKRWLRNLDPNDADDAFLAERLAVVLAECMRRSGDSAFFYAMQWYGAARFLEQHERLERYAERRDDHDRRLEKYVTIGTRVSLADDDATLADAFAREERERAIVEYVDRQIESGNPAPYAAAAKHFAGRDGYPTSRQGMKQLYDRVKRSR